MLFCLLHSEQSLHNKMVDTIAWNAANQSVLTWRDFLENMSIYAESLLCKTCLFISSQRILLGSLKEVNRIISLKLQSLPQRKKGETSTCSPKVSNLSLFCSTMGEKQGKVTSAFLAAKTRIWNLMSCSRGLLQDLVERWIIHAGSKVSCNTLRQSWRGQAAPELTHRTESISLSFRKSLNLESWASLSRK